MPCSDGGPTYQDIREEEARLAEKEERFQLLTREMCYILDTIRTDGFISASDIVDRKELLSWWEKHQIEDAKRLTEESNQKKQRRKELASDLKALKKKLDKVKQELDTL